MEKPNIPPTPHAWARVIETYVPRDAREAAEKETMLALIAAHGDALLGRDCLFAHMTASSMIVNRARTKVLMAYHKIYDSWAWTGGHNDGETDFLAVARREAQEETGINTLRLLGEGPGSIEILPVWTHQKRGRQVSTHLHLNVSYLFEAEESEPLRIAEDENSAVGWIEIARLEEAVTEPPMLPIYWRLIGRENDC